MRTAQKWTIHALCGTLMMLQVASFSMQMSAVGDATVSKARLSQGMVSPSGKMTISPELIIPDPDDLTAILLQQAELPKVSAKLRTQAKASAVFVDGTLQSLRQFVSEQESARGNFPGPLPVVYCHTNDATFSDIADAGACGVVVSVNSGEPVSTADEVSDGLSSIAKSALNVGLQPVPEVVLDPKATWGEKEVTSLVERIKELCGDSPAVVILSVMEGGETEGGEDEELALPQVPKALQKETPIIGSVRTKAGEGRIGAFVKRLKSCGFTGAYVRSDCVPGFRMNPDLEFVGNFWTAAITDLKSVRSKTFGGFRAKNEMDKKDSFVQNWATYQNALVDNDVLPSQSVSKADLLNPELNTDAGDYKGF